MGIISNNKIANNSGGVTLKQLQENVSNAKQKEKISTIFDQYNTTKAADGAEEILDEQEQIAAHAAFDAMDDSGNENNKVSKKEFKNSQIAQELKEKDVNYKTYRAFMEALNKTSENSQTSVVRNGKYSSKYSAVDGGETETTADDAVRQYEITKDGAKRITTPNPPSETPTPQSQSELLFKDDNAAMNAVYKYMLNDNKMSDDDLSDIRGLNTDFGDNGAEIITAKTKDNQTVYSVKYQNKYYKMTKNKDGKLEIIQDAAENYKTENGQVAYAAEKTVESPQTLREAILNSDTTDIKHNYYNKHGIKGNEKSHYNYNSTQITHKDSDPKRQHVNPVQTFASMLLNNNEDSGVGFATNITGNDIIQEIHNSRSPEEKEEGISLKDLMTYLNAVVDEAKETTKKGIRSGSRTAASDVDMDLKDMANIGVLFKHYDADGNGYLKEDELDNLIKDLTTKGNSTTKLAKEHFQNDNSDDGGDSPVTNPTQPSNPNLGGKLNINKTRNEAGTNKESQVNYHMENGLRTLVDKESGRAILNENIAEYEDHGILGAGKKDFVKIKGLPANVRAEITKGSLKNNMIVKVKDANGNTSYYNVNYNADGTYQLGNPVVKKGEDISPEKLNQNKNSILNKLFGSHETPLNYTIPRDLSVEKHHGKDVYKINNRQVDANTARTHVIAYNANNMVSNPQKQVSVSDNELNQYLEQDNQYQSYKQKSLSLQGKSELDKTVDENMFQMLFNDGKDYANVMKNWHDGVYNGMYTRNGHQFTNLEQLTVDGQHIWKSDEGYFYPAPDGYPSAETRITDNTFLKKLSLAWL